MVQETQPYFPPSESQGGWRTLTSAEEVRNIVGMDMETLSTAHIWNEQYPVASAVVVIRRGYLVAEWYANGAQADTRLAPIPAPNRSPAQPTACYLRTSARPSCLPHPTLTWIPRRTSTFPPAIPLQMLAKSASPCVTFLDEFGHSW